MDFTAGDPGRFHMHGEHDPPHPKRSVDRLLAETPPRRLRCFDSDAAWVEFLTLVHDSGDPVVRRQDTGKHSGHRKVIPVLVQQARMLPCEDCKPEFKARMVAVGRCERVSPGNAARRWLRALLLEGPVLASQVRQRAREQGFRQRTIYRAARRLGVVRRRLDPADPQSMVWTLSLAAVAPLLIATFVGPRQPAAHRTDDEADL